MSTHAKSWIILRACSVALIALTLTNVSAAPALRSTKKRQKRQQTATHTPAPGPSLTQTSTTRWKNQRGSTLVLIKDANGNLTGEFRTAVGCGVNKPRKVFGTTNGSGLAFTVNFEECTSIGSWTGQMESPTEIRTLWLLTVDSADPKSFKATYAGSDVFTLVP